MTAKRVLAVVICGVVAINIMGCKDNKAPGKSKNSTRVEAVAAEKTHLVEILETTGDVVATNTVTLEATVEGPISFCPWREGDHIEHAGQKLIEIDRPLYRQEVVAADAALGVAKAELADLKAGARPEEIAEASESVRHFEDCTDFAKADLDRIKSLVESGSLPAEAAEKARVDYVKCHTQLGAAKERLSMLEAGPTETEIAVAQAAVEETIAKCALAQAKLDECLLTAPFPGIITEVYVRPGDLATPRTKLLKMMDLSSLVVRAGLPERSAADIRKGTKASVQLDAFPGKTLNAHIERVYPRLEWESRTRIIEVKIMDPVELIPHLFARVSVQGRVFNEAVVVPDAAIITTPRGNKVVYVVNDGKVSMRKVEIGLEQQNRVQIIDGVQAGEMVVTAGNLKLKDGMLVDMGTPAPGTNNTPVSNIRHKPDQGMNQETIHKSREDHKPRLQQILFHDTFPIRLEEFNKGELYYNSLDELCHFFRDKIEKHPFACYIGIFDHYTHTTNLSDGSIDSGITGAKNVMFCFGKELNDPIVLSVRPRSIGICETKSQFIISFLEAPSPAATRMMEQWLEEINTPAPNIENTLLPGGEEQ